MATRKTSEFAGYIPFIIAGLLTGIIRSLTVYAIWAKEKVFHQPFAEGSRFWRTSRES